MSARVQFAKACNDEHQERAAELAATLRFDKSLHIAAQVAAKQGRNALAETIGEMMMQRRSNPTFAPGELDVDADADADEERQAAAASLFGGPLAVHDDNDNDDDNDDDEDESELSETSRRQLEAKRKSAASATVTPPQRNENSNSGVSKRKLEELEQALFDDKPSGAAKRNPFAKRARRTGNTDVATAVAPGKAKKSKVAKKTRDVFAALGKLK